LGARLNGIQEVTGSNPVRSTSLRSPFGRASARQASELPTREGCRAEAPQGRRRTSALAISFESFGSAAILHPGLLFRPGFRARYSRYRGPCNESPPLGSQKLPLVSRVGVLFCAFCVPSFGAPTLPWSSDARSQATRLRSEECQSHSSLLHRPHLRRQRPPRRSQRRPLSPHRALASLAPSRHHRAS
jgi:hypothetical protein